MKKKLKLKPSVRDKRRYFITDSKSEKKVNEAILKYIGVLGSAKAAYMSVKVKGIDTIVGSCLRKELDKVRAALVLSNIKVEKVSNTIRGLSKLNNKL